MTIGDVDLRPAGPDAVVSGLGDRDWGGEVAVRMGGTLPDLGYGSCLSLWDGWRAVAGCIQIEHIA
jgi:hypothetical protein